MELVHYLRIVRRRWRVVAAFCVVGALLGVATSLMTTGPKVPGTTYYLAKHTLSSSDGTANLNRDAVLCTEGDVPKRVATKIGFDNSMALAAKVTCEAHPETNLLYIAATDTDNKRAVLIADTFAEQLVIYLREVGEKQKAAKIDVIKKQIAGLEASYQQVREELAASPDRKDLLNARLTDLAAQSNTLRDKQNVAESQPAASESLTTLNTAEAVTISQGAFDTLNTSDPTKKTGAQATGINSATRQSQIDAAIKSGNTLGKTTRGGLGAALGLLLGVALVIVLDRVDPRIRTKFEAEEAFGWPVIGEIPPLTRSERQSMTLLACDEPRSRAAEAYRVLRSALLFATTPTELDPETHPIFANIGGGASASVTSDPALHATVDGAVETVPDAPAAEPAPSGTETRGQVIMVTSPGPSEGKTTTAANMAAILGETGRSVIVINCDFRRPRVHLYLGAPDGGRQVVDTRVANVKLVTQVLDNPHDANPAEVVAVQRQVIRNAREMFDIVLLDTAPLLTTNDATEVLAVADQVVVVAKTGKTHKEAADRAAELLERRGGPVVGVVLVGATDVPTSRYYYYGDTPEREEPEPGAEESSPFDALLATAGGATTTATQAATPLPVDAVGAAAPAGAVATATVTTRTTVDPGPASQAPGPDASAPAGSAPSARHSGAGSDAPASPSTPPSTGSSVGATSAGSGNGDGAPSSTRGRRRSSGSNGARDRGPNGNGAPKAKASDAPTDPAPTDPAPTGTKGTTSTTGAAEVPDPQVPATKSPESKSPETKSPASKSPDSKSPDSKSPDGKGGATTAPTPSPADLDAATGNPLDALAAPTTGRRTTTTPAAEAKPSPTASTPPATAPAGRQPAPKKRGRLRGRGAAATPADDFPADLIAFDLPTGPADLTAESTATSTTGTPASSPARPADPEAPPAAGASSPDAPEPHPEPPAGPSRRS